MKPTTLKLMQWLCQALLILAALSTSAYADPIDCAHCGLTGDGPYANLLIGVVDSVPSPAQTQQLFNQVRRTGNFADLPDNAAGFQQAIQPVTLRLPSGHSLTVLIAQDEAQAAPLNPGDLVRFAPHRNIHEHAPVSPPEAIAYWNAVGCIAILCRQKDQACFPRYRPGIYRLTGVAIDDTGHNDATILLDTESFLLKKTTPSVR